MRKLASSPLTATTKLSETDLATVSGGRIRYTDEPDRHATGGDPMGTGSTYGEAIGGTMVVITTTIPC